MADRSQAEALVVARDAPGAGHLGGLRASRRHVEHAVDGGQVGRVIAAGAGLEPAPHGRSGHRSRRGGEGAGVRGVQRRRQLVDQPAVCEVSEAIRGRPSRTFPSVLPLFRLDRIYARGLDVIDARVHYAYPGRRLSDHAALAATFELAAGRR